MAADNELYEAVFAYRASGVTKTEQEIDSLDKTVQALIKSEQELSGSNEISSHLQYLAKSVASMRKQMETTVAVQDKVAKGFHEMANAAKEYANEAKVDALNSRSNKNVSGTAIGELDASSLREFASATDAAKSSTNDLYAAGSRLNGLYERVFNAQLAEEIAAVTRGMESQAAVASRLETAERELAKTTDALKRAEANGDAVQVQNALKNQEAALKAVTKARNEDAKVQSQNKAKDLKLEADAQKANESAVATMQKKAAASTGLVGLTEQLANAQTRLTAATVAYEAAETRWNNAAKTGTLQEQIDASKQLDIAYRELSASSANLNRVEQESINELPRKAYAMRDVARAATVAGTALTAAGFAGTVMQTNMDSAFANVVRTTEAYLDSTGQSVVQLRKEFDALYSTMPTSWENLSDIGTLAGQLNIAKEDVAEFTQLVQQFATTTDVSVEASATAFGRLSALLKVPASEFANLGSSILAVGVNSVATESEIIAISQNIAGMASVAGLSADEVFGLSAALASIGVPPELARSTVTRLFQNIIKATSEGGESLENFARVAGMSADEFANTWMSSPMDAIGALMKSIGQLDQAAATNALADIGVKSIRDIPQVLKLAQNYDILAESLDIAAQGYADGTALQEQYGVVAETVASKLTTLKNNLALLVGDFAFVSEAVKGVLDALTSLVRLFHEAAQTPAGEVFTRVASGAMVLLGAFLLVGGATTALLATLNRLKTVIIETGVSTGLLTTQSGKASMSIRALTAEMFAATGASKALGTALKTAMIGTGVGIALVGISALATAIMNANEKAGMFRDSMDSIQQAALQDTETWRQTGEAYNVLEVDLIGTTEATDEYGAALERVLGPAADASDAVETLTKKVGSYTLALGEATAQQLISEILGDESTRNALIEHAELFDKLGLSIQELAGQMLSGTGTQYLDEIYAKMGAIRQEEINSQPAMSAARKEAIDGWNAVDQTLTRLRGGTRDFSDALADLAIDQQAAAGVTAYFNAELEELDEEIKGTGDSVRNLAAELLGVADPAYAVEEATYSLMKSLYENGDAFDAYSTAGRENFADLQSAVNALADASAGDASAFANNLVSMLAQVEQTGYNTIGSVDWLHQTLINVFNDAYGLNLDTTAARSSIAAFINDAIAALKTMAQLEKKNYNSLNVHRQLSPGTAGPDYSAQIAESARLIQGYDSQIKALEGLKSTLNSAGVQGAKAMNDIANTTTKAGNSARNAGNKAKGAGKKAKKAAEETKEAVVTLLDYANDLSDVWGRAFDIRFGSEAALDDVTKKMREIEQVFEEARQAVKDLRIELNTLNAAMGKIRAEISQQEYFLKIAIEYGDDARAEQIRANLAELNGELAEKQNDAQKTSKELDTAIANTSTTLSGNSDAAIRNRDMMRDLTKAVQDYAEEMVKAGVPVDQINTKLKNLTGTAWDVLGDIGFDPKSLDPYKKAIDDVSFAIKNIPNRVNVKANMDPAQQALNEWLAKDDEKNVKVKADVPSNIDGRGSNLGNVPITPADNQKLTSRNSTYAPTKILPPPESSGGQWSPHGFAQIPNGEGGMWGPDYVQAQKLVANGGTYNPSTTNVTKAGGGTWTPGGIQPVNASGRTWSPDGVKLTTDGKGKTWFPSATKIQTDVKGRTWLPAGTKLTKDASGRYWTPSGIQVKYNASGKTWYPASINVKNKTASGGTYKPKYITVGGRTTVNAVSTGGYIDGSWTQYLASGGVAGLHPGGPRGVDTVPAWLQPGEFVQSKRAVSYYGRDFMEALNNQKVPRYMAWGGPALANALAGLGSGGGKQSIGDMPVTLSAASLQALSRMLSTQLVVDGRVLAQTVGNANRNSTAVGRY